MKVSKQMGQLYVVELSEDNRSNAMPGQFIFSNHDYDDYVLGFINKVDLDENEMEMCLFSPQILPNNVKRVIAEQLTFDETAEKLRVICDANPEVKAAWAEVLDGPTYENEHEVH